MKLKKTTLGFSIGNGGDGSAYVIWFLNENDAWRHQDEEVEGWGETCTGTAETYEGSDIHTEALSNSKLINDEDRDKDDDDWL